MTAILRTVSGRSAVVPDHVDLETVIGLDEAGRIVVHEGWMSDFAFGLTLCCSAFDKGVEDGIVCRACFGQADVGNYLPADGAGSFVGLDSTLTLTARPNPKETPMTEKPIVETVDLPPAPEHRPIEAVVGGVVEFNPTYLDPKRKADKALLGKAVRIEKVNPRTIVVVDEVGNRIRTESWMLQPTKRTFTPAEGPQITLGTLVRLRGKTDLFTVVAIKAGTYNLALVGGNDGRYYRSVPLSQITYVDPAEVLK